MPEVDFIERYRAVGRRIAFYRNKRGWTQEFLADKIGVSTSYLSKIEAPNSRKTFSLDVLFLVSDALEIDPGLLLPSLKEIKERGWM